MGDSQQVQPLKGILSDWMQTVIANESRLAGLGKQYGFPLHVHSVSPMLDNILAITNQLKSFNLKHEVFFARKANRASWFAEEALKRGIGVDVASMSELKEVLSITSQVDRIVLSSAVKSDELINLAIANGVRIVIDSLEEILVVNTLAEKLRVVAKIGVRFSGFQFHKSTLHSRFGVPIADVGIAIELLTKSKFVQLEFLHAHIDKYSASERAEVIFALIGLAIEFRGKKFPIQAVDIGGGVPICYLEKESEWLSFLSLLEKQYSGEVSGVTWGDDCFGLSERGEFNLYPCWNDCSKGNFIHRILTTNSNSKSVADQLKEHNLALFLEPGRALLDQCAFTLDRVMSRKRISTGDWMVGLNLNNSQLKPFRAEFCVDPIWIGNHQSSGITGYLTGSRCSESDFILRRRIFIPNSVQRGSLVVFPNTAGYLMHFAETSTHGEKLPDNILIERECC
jgi:diaminopimelate decarboxylase